ncbi:MAG: hypothetical protein JSV82_02985 [Planctomycetota bacterium]|nr:MAG: hypothetical protein JSV82_02985 [Planctomycetota bacterium]
MKTALTAICTVVLLMTLTGCQPQVEEKELLTDGKLLLAVDFQQGKTLRYKFLSRRDIEINWGAMKGGSKSGKGKVDKVFESVEMVVAYTPIEVDPFGLTTIKATCESVKVNQTSPTGRQHGRKDAVETFAGKTFTFSVNATGKIEDNSELEALIKEAGEKAFRPKTKKGKIKEPDMIGDFIATQWFLWNSISSIEKPAEGIAIGQTWNSQLSVPVTMILIQARNVNYTLDEIRQSEKGRLALIRSSYSLPKITPRIWPLPYSGTFHMMSGRFGFLRGYKALSLEGQGEELFNIDAGRIEKYNQQYEMQLRSSLPMGLSGIVPITVKQKLTMELLEDQQKIKK